MRSNLNCGSSNSGSDKRRRRVAALSPSESDAATAVQESSSVVVRKRTTVGSLFAGMGGFCRAFREEGFDVVWANENDQFAVQTYNRNFPTTRLHAKSIETLSVVGDKLPHVDVMTAGFPCQPFSVAGTKAG